MIKKLMRNKMVKTGLFLAVGAMFSSQIMGLLYNIPGFASLVAKVPGAGGQPALDDDITNDQVEH